MPLSAHLCRIIMFAYTAKQTVFCGSLLKSRCDQRHVNRPTVQMEQ